jgi:hypothetical protein
MLKNNVLLLKKKFLAVTGEIDHIQKKARNPYCFLKRTPETTGNIFAAKLTSYNQIMLFKNNFILLA